jgi:hypothetical protein
MKFLEVYKKHLHKRMTGDPKHYRRNFDDTYKLTCEMIIDDNFLIDATIKATCRELGIGQTTRAVLARLKEEGLKFLSRLLCTA